MLSAPAGHRYLSSWQHSILICLLGISLACKSLVKLELLHVLLVLELSPQVLSPLHLSLGVADYCTLGMRVKRLGCRSGARRGRLIDDTAFLDSSTWLLVQAGTL